LFTPLPTRRIFYRDTVLVDFSEQGIAVAVDGVSNLPGPECEVFLAHVGGPAGRVPRDSTAFPQRATHFMMT
jgi:hypothetical protein